ncbi:MAG: UPF0175 family protein [Promethearchaeota archaeon]
MTEQINIRLDKEIIKGIEKLAAEEKLDRSALVRKILIDGLNRERLNFAIQKYVLGEISFERAAEIAEVSIHELLLVFGKLGISPKMTLDDLKKVA